MKRVLTALASFILAIPLCVSAFAVAPYSARAGICPRCDKPSLHSREVGTERGVLEPRPCIHYRYGEDYIYPLSLRVYDACLSCTDAENPWHGEEYDILIGSSTVCHGYQ